MKIKLVTIIAALGMGFFAQAEYPQRAEARKVLSAFLAVPGQSDTGGAGRSADIEDKTRICGYCHGKDGNSTHSEIPSLAGQNPQYVIEQLLLFKRNIRRYPKVMHDIAQKMSPNTMASIALHFAALPRRRPGGVIEEKAVEGEKLYTGLCANCHGADGRGANKAYAAINAQLPSYIVTSLKRFRDGSPVRSSHEMRIAARGMNDREIESLAHYIAGL